jgi:pilus assembly protein Flp/PilA
MTLIKVRAMAPLERRAAAARTLKMLTFRNNLRALIKDERGVTAMEYGLIAALVAVVIIGSVTTIGTSLTTTFGKVATALAPAG